MGRFAGLLRGLGVLFVVLFSLFAISDTFAQEVIVLTSNGDRITGSLLEYRDDKLRIRTQGNTMEISAKDLVLIEFVSNRAQVSGESYLHLSNGKKLLELGMEAEAMEEFRAAIRKSPMYADAHYELGVLLEKQGRAKEALESIDRAIAIDPGHHDMAKRLLDVADNYFNRGDLASAAERYYLLFTRYPESEAAEYAVYRAGFLFAENLKNNKKALAALEGAVAAFPTGQYADRGYYELGRIYEEEGAPKAAESALVQLVSNFPSSQWLNKGRYMLARVYHQQRRNEDAIREIANLLNESSDAPLISSAEKLLDECIWVIYSVPDGLPSNEISALARDGNYIWVGTSAGIALFDLESDSFAGEILLKGTEIRALAADNDHLWVGTQNLGVMQYDKARRRWLEDESLPSDRIMAISLDSNDVWLGTAMNGVYRYGKADGNWSIYSLNEGLSSNNILSIASTPSGIIWCGTLKNGACFFNKSTGRWQRYLAMAHGKSVTVTSIAGGPRYTWLAWYENQSNGTSRYDSVKKAVEDITIAEWEGASMVNLDANSGGMWIGTDTGVLFYDHATSSWSRSFNYPAELKGHVPPVCVLIEDDSVWFATSRGLGRLDRSLVDRIEEIKLR